MLRAIAGLAILIATIAPASATIINPGQPVYVNFDFSSQTPAPPYQTMEVVTNIDGTTVIGDGEVDIIQIIIYDGLNGTGSSQGGPIMTDSYLIAFASSLPAMLDGVFSVGFLSLEGSYEIGLPYARATTSDGTRVLSDGTISNSAVPEPATLALLGIGLAGMAISRRRAKS